MLRKLAQENLVLLQITIVTLNDSLRKILEPRAPSIEDRIIAIDKAASEGIPVMVNVVIRYRPLIPGIIEAEVDEVLRVARDNKVKHVIVEFLRCEASELEVYKNLAYVKDIYEYTWGVYSPVKESSKIVRPPLHYRIKVLELIKNMSQRYGVNIALCKEGQKIF